MNDAAPDAASGDMSRRAMRRRQQLGKSIDDVAAKAGLDPATCATSSSTPAPA
jgi:hypothetical protein